MKRFAALIAALCLSTAVSAQAEEKPMAPSSSLSFLRLEDACIVTPALEKYIDGPIADLWKRPELSIRDRSIVTLAGLIARNQMSEIAFYVELALDNGVKPAEISEMITH